MGPDKPYSRKDGPACRYDSLRKFPKGAPALMGDDWGLVVGILFALCGGHGA
jgi:hypothetical protein